MMGNYKRCSVVFNRDNPTQNDLHQWCMDQSTNFSDFARSVLFSYKQSQTSNLVSPMESQLLKPSSPSDADAMSGLL